MRSCASALTAVPLCNLNHSPPPFDSALLLPRGRGPLTLRAGAFWSSRLLRHLVRPVLASLGAASAPGSRPSRHRQAGFPPAASCCCAVKGPLWPRSAAAPPPAAVPDAQQVREGDCRMKSRRMKPSRASHFKTWKLPKKGGVGKSPIISKTILSLFYCTY